MSQILVVGSINMDLVISLDEIPKIGETVLGKSLEQIPGGKGANQAVAMAKLDKSVSFLGKVGSDPYADILLTSMEKARVNIEAIERAKGPTGIAVINVDKNGNNNIVVIPGSNWQVNAEYLQKHVKAFEVSDIVLFQLEIPIESVKEGLKLAKNLGKTTILNPAPARVLDDETVKNIDILIPNEHELARMAEIEIKDEKSMIKAGRVLLDKGIKEIIVTLGSKGVLYINENFNKFYKSFKVDVVDTTAAGDSFIGGFVSSFIEDKDIEKAIARGQKTASLAIQKFGAQSSLPTKEQVEGGNYE